MLIVSAYSKILWITRTLSLFPSVYNEVHRQGNITNYMMKMSCMRKQDNSMHHMHIGNVLIGTQ